jgi:dTDP-glucose pyrophosphorylase
MQIIPLAGKGNRFKIAGYSSAKYLLPLQGLTVIEHILSYFNKSIPTLLILNLQDNNKKRIELILLSLGFVDYEVVEIGDTNGQLTSVIYGIKRSRFCFYKGPVWIFNGDTVRKRKLPYYLFGNTSCDGFIEVFRETGTHWSFVDAVGIVSTITEKDKISDFCCTGLYGFREFEKVIDYFDSGGVKELKNELYVSSVYKKMLEDGMCVFSFESPRNDFLLCGTPEEYSQVVSE